MATAVLLEPVPAVVKTSARAKCEIIYLELGLSLLFTMLRQRDRETGD